LAPAPLTLAQLRRDRVLIWCWLPIGGFAMFLVVKGWQLLAGEPPPGLYTTLDVVWIVVTFSLIWRRSTSRCPTCGHRYLRGFPWMSLKKVECARCGYKLPEA
jgi:DNA-directed RNA polymerase subunit RPC12/RpoP